MTDDSQKNEDLEKIVGASASQGTGAKRAAASQHKQRRSSAPSAPVNVNKYKSWVSQHKGLVSFGIVTAGALVAGRAVKNVFKFLYEAKPKQLFRAGAAIGMIYFATHMSSCTHQIKSFFVKDGSESASQYSMDQEELDSVKKKNYELGQRINELTSSRSVSSSLEHIADDSSSYSFSSGDDFDDDDDFDDGSSSSFSSDDSDSGYESSEKSSYKASSGSSRAGDDRLGTLSKPDSVKSLEVILNIEENDYERLLYVSKTDQTVTLFNIEDGKAVPVKKYACTTGANPGPREREGDKRTPEGVYHISTVYDNPENRLLGTKYFGWNYPNDRDLSQGRNGKGVGFAGTYDEHKLEAIAKGIPSSNCGVVMSNDDVEDLYAHISQYADSTIIISENLKRPLSFTK